MYSMLRISSHISFHLLVMKSFVVCHHVTLTNQGVLRVNRIWGIVVQRKGSDWEAPGSKALGRTWKVKTELP